MPSLPLRPYLPSLSGHVKSMRLFTAIWLVANVLSTGTWAGAATANGSKSAPKKTVCTVTINSSDEADAFKKHLSPELWNFVELANPEDSKPGWFRAACEKHVSCDILILSGHFGGTFFGANSEVRLSMEDLETASCQSSCQGITARPKEVFLFGCNTLASKDRDTRSPEQYQRVLIADGFSVAQASQIAAFRYSAFGDSFRGRMAQVFANTSRIYGFSALAPTGAHVAPMLDRYLDASENYYASFDAANSNLKSGTNTVLKQAFTRTTLTQVPGLAVALKAVAGPGKSQAPAATPYCYLASEVETRLSKLKYVQLALHEGRAFNFISHVDQFVHLSVSQPPALSDDERKVLTQIGQDTKIRKDFEQYLRLPGDVYLPVRVNVLNLMKSLGLISSDEHAKRVLKNLALDFSRPITREKVDKICSFDVRAEIEASQIPDPRWSEYETFSLLRCLRPQNSGIQERLTDMIANSSDVQLAFNASWALAEIKVTDTRMQRRLADVVIKHRNPDVRKYAIDALSGGQKLDANVTHDLVRVMTKDPDWSMRQAAVYAFRAIPTSDVTVLMALVNTMLHDEVWGIRSGAGEALRALDPKDPSLQAYRTLWEGPTL